MRYLGSKGNAKDLAVQGDIVSGGGSQGQSTRRMPMSYYLDRTTVPWTIWFDNGCGLQLPQSYTPQDLEKNNSAYGYGVANGINLGIVAQYPIPAQVIKTSMGSVSKQTWRNATNITGYWHSTTVVLNPINDITDWDFSGVVLNPKDTGTYLEKQKNVVRVMFELGVWSEQDIEGFGAVKLI